MTKFSLSGLEAERINLKTVAFVSRLREAVAETSGAGEDLEEELLHLRSLLAAR